MKIRVVIVSVILSFLCIPLFSQVQIGNRYSHSLQIGVPYNISSAFIYTSGNIQGEVENFKRIGLTLDYRFEFLPRHFVEIGYLMQAYGVVYRIKVNVEQTSNLYSRVIADKRVVPSFSIPIKYVYKFHETPSFKQYVKVGYQRFVPYSYYNSGWEGFGGDGISYQYNIGSINRSHLMTFEYGIEYARKTKPGKSYYIAINGAYGFDIRNEFTRIVVYNNYEVVGRSSLKINGSYVGVLFAYRYNNVHNEK